MILQEPSFNVIRFNNKQYKEGSFLLTKPMEFIWSPKRCVVTVEEGFITNFASIPAACRGFFPVNGLHRLPAVAHDYLYSNGGKIKVFSTIATKNVVVKLKEPATIYYTREDADRLFYDFMIEEGVNKTKAQLMHTAVRWFGQSNWGIT